MARTVCAADFVLICHSESKAINIAVLMFGMIPIHCFSL